MCERIINCSACLKNSLLLFSMKIKPYHLNPSGLSRAASQTYALMKLLSRHRASIFQYFPDCVNSGVAAWNHYALCKTRGIPFPKTIIDVGANNSQMTKLLRLSSPDAEVYSFEPNPACKPVGKVYRCALSIHNGRTSFYTPSRSGSELGTLIEPDCEHEVSEVHEVRFETLSQNGSVSILDMAKPVLLKIDTEGTELEVLQGFGGCLVEVDVIICEVGNRRLVGSDMHKIFNHISSYGFNRALALYACWDGWQMPAYMDFMFWKQRP